ncbi:aminotransferase family protein [Natrarchaeobius oligotrophus]|uniref:Aspartate aminotransferase family protein n=1 Tax=Natrarchaeobius chitinivorans TaxID=1679083 RepID=A0A3N6MAE0_NATCH|nr:aminotransferase class III-fold pyridoxal phosphate-dependent enzyme [Natrarchaeobius chitinivorans]RQG99447.1 aspartate aminotransferase family protein [Natrarchaeobius chitinivorans]
MVESSQRSDVLSHWHHPGVDVPTIVDGDGAYVTDADGRTYLDALSQLCCVNLGHSNDRIAAAMSEQLERVQFVSPGSHNDVRTELADRILAVGPERHSDVFFSVSGSEANEVAVHLARAMTDAPTVLTRYRSYHGTTLGTGTLGGDTATRTALSSTVGVPGSAKFLPPLSPEAFDVDDPDELADRAIAHLEFVIRNEGPDSIAALLTEVVGGSSGAYAPPPGYFERVRSLCDEYDILLVADEVLTGFGRCGEWFAHQTEGIEPDLMSFAKGVTSAHAPLAGVTVSEEIGSWVRREGVELGQTFGGHALSCSAGIAAIDEYDEWGLDAVNDVGPYLERRLRGVESDHDVVADVRGRGLLFGLPIVDPETGRPFVDPRVDAGENPVDAVADRMADEGVLTLPGRPSTQLILAPPFCVDRDDVDRVIEALEIGLEAVFG